MPSKLRFATKLKMWNDYLKYLIFLQQGETVRVALSFIIFILSLYLLKHELTTKLNDHGDTLSFIFILIIIKFIWEAYITRSDIKSYFHIQRSILRNILHKPFVQPGEKERLEGFVPIEIPGSKADLIYSSQKINRHLQTTPLLIKMSDAKQKHINKYIQTHREILLQYLNHYFFTSLRLNRLFTNDEKICLSRDLSLNSKQATCHKGFYYDSFLTNQVSGTTLVIKDKAHTTITTEHIFPSHEDESGTRYLYDVSSSRMNDHLGCSTIGFTQDHYLLVWNQSSASQFSRDMLAPTGSGSSSISDLKGTLQETVIKTMERELMEETATISPQDNRPLKTLPLGFYRWVTRGGKPEFSGITKLPGIADDYKPSAKEQHIGKADRLKFKVETIDDLPKTLKEIRTKNLSTPLYMCLYQLEEMYESNKAELERFMFR